jgi:hypothetical protein
MKHHANDYIQPSFQSPVAPMEVAAVAVMPDMPNLVIQITGHNTHYNLSKSHHRLANRTMMTDPSHQSMESLNCCGKWEDHNVAR